MKIIPVKVQNKLASVPCYIDDEDYFVLKNKKWCLGGGGKVYAQTNVSNKILEIKNSCVLMHNIILWCPKKYEIDHKDGEPLNNQKSNLRICTRSQNQMNKSKHKDNISGFKGVRKVKNKEKWTAQISKDKKIYYLGSFNSPEAASEAFKNAAMEMHGEYAKF